jgi:hypothetical protein
MTDQRLARGGFVSEHQFSWRNLRLVVLVSMGACAFGYGVSIIGTTLGEPGFLLYMGLVDPATGQATPNSSGLVGAITGTFYVGAFPPCSEKKLTLQTGRLLLRSPRW